MSPHRGSGVRVRNPLWSHRNGSSHRIGSSCSGAKQPTLVLLDRDGVLNYDVGTPGVLTVGDFSLLPGAAQAVARLKRHGAVVCVCTNQTCVGKGLISQTRLDEIHDHMRVLLIQQGGPDAVLDGVFVATTSTDEECDRRKPAPGMVLEAVRTHGFEGDEKNVTFVGDTVHDAQAAYNAGVPNRITVGTGHGQEVYEALREAHGGEVEGDKKRTVFVVNYFCDIPHAWLAPETLPITVVAAVEVIVTGIKDSNEGVDVV